ncbi:DNA alkylation repair protein [Candidatus Micrarchaeota archaeon]|nr:DNA alkylation repair protein [Candidatus Micrarchaeota archaeon]
MLERIVEETDKIADPEKAKILSGFFKTGKGQYGEGDIFLGIIVPESRKIAKKYSGMDFGSLEKLLNSEIHEHRLIALLILVEKFKKAKRKQVQKEIFDFYFANSKKINNWDLVDLSADKIVGEYLFDKDKAILYGLARSENLWQRRIAIVATFNFIKKGKFSETLEIAKILMNDQHDLIHKAVGWMIREIGKRDQGVEEKFLKKYYKLMPRTMLRYAIERFSYDKKKFYMAK